MATNKPPMIANAIGPQNTVGAIGIKPSTVEIAVSMIGRKRESVASTTASKCRGPAPLGLDLIDQDDGVARDHADQRENAENRHEAERPVGDEERENDADQSERHGRHDQRHAPETVQLRHQEEQHQE